ncbi:MAG TPA: ROK family glucokinase [Pyrinomonadaceae bacterium]|jgi:glucokinase
MNRGTIAGIDIGGTKIAVALADPSGQILSLSRFPTEVDAGPHRILDKAIEEIQRMAEETEASLLAVGVGCGGPLDRERGLILSPPNLPGWNEFPIIEIIEKRLGVHALLDNDANAAALGEQKHGAGRGLKDLVYMTISTGIGGGIIIKGEILHGVGDAAGEVGHITILPDGPPCRCGQHGCLETLCSGTGIARRARERLATGAESSIRMRAGGADKVTAKIVAEAAREGDPVAVEIWDETINYLAIGISNIISIVAPEAVILGGGVSTAGEQLLEPLRRQIQSRVKMLPIEKISILQAKLGGDSGIHGALILGQRAVAL